MNVIEFIFAPYLLKFKTPFHTSRGAVSERKGFIINLKSSSGIIGVGDASPLPEFGSESFEETEEALENLKFRLEVDLNNISDSLKNNLKLFDNLPALRHGIEQAVLNFITKEKNISLARLLNVEQKKEVNVNATIGLEPVEESLKKVYNYLQNGFKTLKLKLGRDDFQDDFSLIKKIREKYGNNFKLRVDINGKWNKDEAVLNVNSLKDFNIEYVEDPVKKSEDFINISEKVSVPLAADEPIKNYKDALNFINSKAAAFLILKPMMIGGLLPTLDIIKAVEKNNLKTVITSSFESAIGRASAVFAASSINSELAHGLAVSDLFVKDLIDDPYPVINGKIIINP